MRGRWTCLLGVLTCVWLGGCGGEGGTTVTMADIQPDGYPTVVGMREMARLVEEKSDGAMRFRLHVGAAMGRSEDATLSQTRDGDIHINRVSAAPLQQYASAMGVLAMPYIFRDDEHMWKVLNSEIGDELLASLEGSGLVGLGWQHSGSRSFYATRPIRSIDDLRGLQIRVQNNEVMTGLVGAVGASARTLGYDEVYTALQSGTIHAAENNPPSFHSSGHYQVAPHYLLNEHSRIPEVIVASKRWWDGLSAEQQQWLREAARAQQQVQREAWAVMEQSSLEAVRQVGVTVIELDDAEREAFRKAMQPLYDRYEAEFGAWIRRIEAMQ